MNGTIDLQGSRSSGSSSPFSGLPSVADLIRATDTMASQATPRRGTKRRHTPADEEIQPSTRKDSRAYATRASKRSRTDSLHTDQHELGSPSVQSITNTNTFTPHLESRSPSGSPLTSSPEEVENRPVLLEQEHERGETPYRTGFEPYAIGIWVSELLNDRFTMAAALQEGDSFLKDDYMQQLSKKLTSAFYVLNPSNLTAFIALVYLERLLRKSSLKWKGVEQQERCDMVKRTYIILLHLALVWTDDVPWSITNIAEVMDLSLKETKSWQLASLNILGHNLTVSPSTTLRWLDALQEHAYSISFQDNLEFALEDVFDSARDDVWKEDGRQS